MLSKDLRLSYRHTKWCLKALEKVCHFPQPAVSWLETHHFLVCRRNSWSSNEIRIRPCLPRWYQLRWDEESFQHLSNEHTETYNRRSKAPEEPGGPWKHEHEPSASADPESPWRNETHSEEGFEQEPSLGVNQAKAAHYVQGSLQTALMSLVYGLILGRIYDLFVEVIMDLDGKCWYFYDISSEL